MLCERILGKLSPDRADDPSIDWLDLTWLECTRRALRKETRAGVEVNLLLPIGQTPRHGDILVFGDTTCIAISLLPTQVLIAHPGDVEQMGRLALELGNLHLPVQIDRGSLITLPDGPVEALLSQLRIPCKLESRRFCPEKCSTSALPVKARSFSISRADS